PHPWRKQINIYVAYASFYNPLNLVRAVLDWNDPVWDFRVLYQFFGMAGLVKSLRQGLGWFWGLYNGPVAQMERLARERLLMVRPPVAPDRPAPVLQAQTV